METIWRVDGGFTPAANEPHEFKSQAPRLFKDLTMGETFRRGYSFEQVFEKIDERHFQNPDTGETFEIDPYDGVY